MSKVIVQAIYDCDVVTAGCNGGPSWRVSKSDYTDLDCFGWGSFRRVIVVTDTGAYVSNELLSVLHFIDAGISAGAYSTRYLQIGQRKLFRLNQALVEACLEHACYPRRSQREQQVAARNMQALTWMVDNLPIAN
jgi:hypothetical protein